MIVRALQRVLLAAYRGVAATGLLDLPRVRVGYERAYFLYKALVESRNVELLRPLVRPGTSIVDVGANVGFFTLRFASWVSGEGRVLALEPEDRNCERLRSALSRSGVESRVEVIPLAVADTPGDGFLEINPLHPGDHRLGAEGVRVTVTTIDDLLGERHWPAVSLIKIDVQGAEARVLAGASRTLEKFRPAIFLEVHDESLRRQGSDARTLLESCLRLGYSPRLLSARGVSPPQPVDRLLELANRRDYVDVLLLPTEEG